MKSSTFFTKDDYLYVKLDNDNTTNYPKIFDKGYDSKGNYIITNDPIIVDNYKRYSIRHTNQILSKNYEHIKYVPRYNLDFYTKNGASYIGGGLYGRVYKSGVYAIKTFVNTFPYESNYLDSSYLRETATLLRLNHPNIIELIDILEGTPSQTLRKDSLSIVMPLASMNLQEYINKNTNIGKEYIAYELFKGFNYLQNKDIIHADIKLDNVLLFKSNSIIGYDVKISDFGISNHTSCQPSKLSNEAYTSYYRPIEVILKIGFGISADIWALATMIYTLYTGVDLFRHHNDNIEYDQINILKDGPIKDDLYNKYQKNLPKKVLQRMIKILGNPLNDWPELIELINNKYENLYNMNFYTDQEIQEIKNIKDEYITLFKNGEYHPQIIKAGLKDDGMYNIIMKMLRYNPKNRVKLSEILLDDYFKKLKTYDANVEQTICDNIIDNRQKYPTILPIITDQLNINNIMSIRKTCFNYILEKIKKYTLDDSDFYMICYIFDTCYNSSVNTDDITNFTIACISIWTTFKYGEAKGIPTMDQYNKHNDNTALTLISKYCRMIVNILSNDLTVTTIIDYNYENNNSERFLSLLEDSMVTDAPFKYLAKDIYKSMQIYYYKKKYIDIITDINNKLSIQ